MLSYLCPLGVAQNWCLGFLWSRTCGTGSMLPPKKHNELTSVQVCKVTSHGLVWECANKNFHFAFVSTGCCTKLVSGLAHVAQAQTVCFCPKVHNELAFVQVCTLHLCLLSCSYWPRLLATVHKQKILVTFSLYLHWHQSVWHEPKHELMYVEIFLKDLKKWVNT